MWAKTTWLAYLPADLPSGARERERFIAQIAEQSAKDSGASYAECAPKIAERLARATSLIADFIAASRPGPKRLGKPTAAQLERKVPLALGAEASRDTLKSAKARARKKKVDKTAKQ